MKSETPIRKKLIGLFGGSFDPIHLGHTHLAQKILENYHFEKLFFLPAKQNPLKEKSTKASASLRLALIRAALKETQEARFEIWDTELTRPGPSYTIETLQEIQIQFPNRDYELVLILGNEVFAEFPRWKNPQGILRISNLCVVERISEKTASTDDSLKQIGVKYSKSANFSNRIETEFSHWIEKVSIDALPYSSTEVRKNILKARDSKDLQNTPQGIQRSVWLLIKENQLYTVE